MKTQVDNLKVEYSATKDQLKNQTEIFKTREDILTNTIIKLKRRKPKVKVIVKETRQQPSNITQRVIVNNKEAD